MSPGFPQVSGLFLLHFTPMFATHCSLLTPNSSGWRNKPALCKHLKCWMRSC